MQQAACRYHRCSRGHSMRRVPYGASYDFDMWSCYKRRTCVASYPNLSGNWPGMAGRLVASP